MCSSHHAAFDVQHRRLFRNLLARCIREADSTPVTLLRLSIRGLDRIEYRFGRRIRTVVMSEVESRLRNLIPDEYLLVCTGIDEFAIIARDLGTTDEAAALAEILLYSLEEPVHAMGRDFVVFGCLAIGLYPDHARSAARLERSCGIALAEAKNRGPSGIVVFDSSIQGLTDTRMQLESDLRRAVDQEELFLQYQPQFDLVRRRMVAVEALLRWKHRRLGAIPPAQFIPVSEQTGIILRLGKWVLEEACRQGCTFQRTGMASVKVAVNVSPLQFASADFVGVVQAALRENNLDPRCLILEVTETAIMHQVEQAICRIEQLRALGVRLSLDDFGTGYSSLSHLRTFPIDEIKIDRSFLRDVDRDTTNIPLVEAMIALGHSLGLTIVAEGIETESQLDILRAAGCDYGQGYLMAKPVMPAELYAFWETEAPGALQPVVLVVEDEEMVLGLVRRVLQRRGCRVLEARNGRDAATIFRKRAPTIDLVVLDMLLPGIGGHELAGEMLSVRPELSILYISGYHSQGATSSLQADGVRTRFLGKPFAMGAFEQVVDDLLENRSARVH